MEELADNLKLGPKFYVISYSTGGALGWECLKYIPHRLAGVILMAPAINNWWPSLPSNLVEQAFDNEGSRRQCNLLITHYTPWFLYWWNTQQVIPQSKSIYKSPHYVDILIDSDRNKSLQEYSTQQRLYESYLRDAMVLFGEWEVEPSNLENPFSQVEGYVHIWQGDMDEAVPVSMQRYIVENLPWIYYQEIPNVGHMFALEDDNKYLILKSLVTHETKVLLSTNGTKISRLFL